MSDPTDPPTPSKASETKPDAPKSESPETDPAKPKRSRGQKWRRRIIAFLVIVIFLGFAFRALVPLLLPTVMRSIASDYGLTAEYDKFDFYPLAGDVGLWNLRLTPMEGGEPVLKVGYCRGAVDVWSLLQGRILVERAEADGAEVTVERGADGSIPLLERFLDKSAPTPPAPGAVVKPTEIPLESPLYIRALRLQHAQARLIDKTVAPTTDVRLILNMILSDVGSPSRPTVFSIQLNSPELLGALYVDGSALARDRKIDADLAVRMVGLNPQPVRAYLAAFGIAPLARDLTGEAKGKLHVTPAAGPTTLPSGEPAPITALAATLTFSDISLTADSKPAASVGKVEVIASTLAPGEIRIDSVDVHAVRARGWRDSDGRLGFAGLAVGADPTTQPVVKLDRPASEKAAPTTTPTVSSLPIFELKSMKVRDIAIAFDDFAAGTALSIDLDHFTVAGVSTDPKDAGKPATIELAASAPGVAGAIHASGQIAAATETKTFAMKVSVDQITGERLDPYLAPLGLTRAMQNAHFTCDLNGSFQPLEQGAMTLGFDVQNLLLADAQQEWFAFPKISVSDVRVSDAASHIRLGKIEVRGPAMRVKRASDGSITMLGFTFDPTKVAPAKPAKTSATAATNDKPTAPLKLPVVELGSFKWDGVALSLDDLTSDPPVSVALNDLAVTADELKFDPKSAPDKPGRISVHATAPGNVEKVSIEGTLAPTGDALALNLNGDLSGITLKSLKPLLGTFGVEPVLEAGKLTFGVRGDVKRLDQGTRVNLTVDGVALGDGKQTWIRSSGLAIENLSFDLKTLAIDKVRVEPSVLHVERDAAGAIRAAGIKLIAPTNAPPPAPVDPEAPPIPSRVELKLPLVAKINTIEVKDAGADFVDHAVKPNATLSPRVNLSLSHLVMGADEGPAKLDLRLTVPGVVEQLTVAGDVHAAPSKQAAGLTITGRGVSGSAIAPYLPPGITPSSDKGTIDAKFAASLTPNERGGSAISIGATNVAVGDGIAKEPSLKLDWLRLVIDRFDLEGKVVAIREAGSSGVSLRVTEDDRGIVLPFLAIGAAPQGTPDVVPAPKAVDKQAAVGAATDVKDLLAAGRVQAAWITIDRMAMRADKISIQTKDMASPLVFDGLCIWNATPIDLLGADPQRRPAFDLEVYGGVQKLLDRLTVTTSMRPFASEPYIHAKVEAVGIHANEITAMVPKLAETIDANGLSDGRFTANVELSQLVFTRRGLWGIDFTRDVGGEVLVKNTALYQSGVEKPLAGVEEIRAEKIRITPKVDGGIAQVSIKRVDIVKPAAHIVRDASGISALGVTLKMPATAQPTDPASAQDPVPAPAEKQPAEKQVEQVEQKLTEAVSALDPQGDLRIDSFNVSGIDLLVEDRVGDPVTLIPITELDVDVRGINTRALREPLPIKFSVLAGSGKVNDKDVFAQFTASGALTVYPKPNGWIKSSLSGFELTSVKGVAQQAGIGLGGGTFDFATDVRMEGLDTFNAKLYPQFNNLSVADSEDGKLSKFFGLSVPLNIAIVAVQDQDGSISLPVVVPLKAGELDTGKVIGSAASAVGVQMMRGVGKPVAVVGQLVTGAIFGGPEDLRPIVLTYASGESQLTTEQLKAIEHLAQRLRKDDALQAQVVHTLGSADVVLAEQRASPSKEEARQLGQQLRQQKLDLQRRRVELSSTLRIAMASQNQALTDQTLTELQQVSAQIAHTEAALDDMLGLLRPGAQRTLDRRGRQAAIELGQYRLDAVRDVLKSIEINGFDTRVTAPRPAAKVGEGAEQGSITIVLTRQAKDAK